MYTLITPPISFLTHLPQCNLALVAIDLHLSPPTDYEVHDYGVILLIIFVE